MLNTTPHVAVACGRMKDEQHESTFSTAKTSVEHNTDGLIANEQSNQDFSTSLVSDEDKTDSLNIDPIVSRDEISTTNAVEPVKVVSTLKYGVLVLNCLLAFGGTLVFDLCATLQVLTINCQHCLCFQSDIMKSLDISNTEYSLLYVVYAWTNCAMVLFAGALIDRTTNRMCAIIFCGLACLGQSILSVGVQCGIFGIMVAGRSTLAFNIPFFI